MRSQSHFTMLVILKKHERTYDTGVGVNLSNIWELYWIIKGRQIVKKVLCVLLKFIQGQMITSLDTPYLQSFRIKFSHAFERVGVDYAGPVFYKNVKKKKTELFKSYILLIICAVTRVGHIEVTPDVGSYSLKVALIRFFWRRGVSKLVIVTTLRVSNPLKLNTSYGKKILNGNLF